MRVKRIALVAGATGLSVLMSGCGGSPGPAATVTMTAQPSPAPTVTVTMAAPTRSPSDPLSSIDAWSACYAAVHAEFDLPGDSGARTFDPAAITASVDGSFEVEIVFPGVLTTCSISGTLGRPVLTLSSIDI